MTPYMQMHGVYFVVTLLVTLVLHLLCGRISIFRSSRRRRFVAEVAGVSLLTIGLAAFLLFVLRKETAAAFMAVAFGLYSGSFCLPSIWLLESLRRERRDWLISVASVSLILLGLYGLLIEPNRLTVRKESLTFEQWPASGAPVRLVHISDLQSVGFCEREAEAARMINDLDPDVIVFTGDYIAGPFNDVGPAVEAARRFLSALESKHGILAIAGHSENDPIRQDIFRGLGNVQYIKDEARVLDVGEGRLLRIYGLDLDHRWESHLNLDDVPSPDPTRTVNVFASHVPDISSELEGQGVDLHVAGHTHGGQIIIPGFGPLVTLSKLPREHSRGLFMYGDHRLNICAGIGMEGNHAPRIRLFCPPEICLILLSGRP